MSGKLYCSELIRRCYDQKYTVDGLKVSIARDDYHHQGSLPNNFLQTLPAAEQALRAVSTFKDEYLLDYINVEELNIRDKQDVDERVIKNAIIHNVKNFILTFGKDFAFIRNQYHLDAFGEDQYEGIRYTVYIGSAERYIYRAGHAWYVMA